MRAPKGSLSVKWGSEGKDACVGVSSCYGPALEILGGATCPKLCASGVLRVVSREKLIQKKLLSVRFLKSNIVVLSPWWIFIDKE